MTPITSRFRPTEHTELSAPSALSSTGHALTAASPGQTSELPDGSAVGVYRCIVADPPWAYDIAFDKHRGTPKYGVMTLDDIKALPVASSTKVADVAVAA